MTTDYAVKLGDDDPPLEAILKDGTGQPADLTAVSEIWCSVRDAGTLEPVLSREAEVVDPTHQTMGHTNRGRVRVTWAEGDTLTMGVGEKEAEFQVTRSGRLTTWPSAGYVPFTIWQDIVPDDIS